MATKIPAVGDPFTVRKLSGYVLEQHRPSSCRGWHRSILNPGQYTGGCECGKCNGVTTTYPGTVEKVIYWADNSIDVEVRCDDGQLRRQELVAPHGDLCF